MSRIRTIKPEAFESLTLARVPIPARWLFAGLWTMADDEGRLHDSPPLIRSKVFPVEDVPLEQITEWLNALIGETHLCRYVTPEGVALLHIPGWHTHQVINRPTPTRLPACPYHPTERPAASRPRTRNPRPTLTPV